MKQIECPYCYSAKITKLQDSGRFLCRSCECMFDERDIELEQYRHRISAVLSANYATEENPLHCDITIGENDAQGLSSLELPRVSSIFETQDGVIYFNVEGLSEPMEFDDMQLDDLAKIADELK